RSAFAPRSIARARRSPNGSERCPAIGARSPSMRGDVEAAVERRASSKMRLDALLAERGLFETRSRAAASVVAGEVGVGAHRARATKAGAAAATGGFADCVLASGAASVVALDVAYGELSWKLPGDPRVTVIERFNARELRPDVLPYAPEVIVADLAFISLRTVLGALLACAAPRFDALCLVKPQFEVGRGLVGRGGVVRDGALRRRALLDVSNTARDLGASVR